MFPVLSFALKFFDISGRFFITACARMSPRSAELPKIYDKVGDHLADSLRFWTSSIKQEALASACLTDQHLLQLLVHPGEILFPGVDS